MNALGLVRALRSCHTGHNPLQGLCYRPGTASTAAARFPAAHLYLSVYPCMNPTSVIIFHHRPSPPWHVSFLTHDVGLINCKEKDSNPFQRWGQVLTCSAVPSLSSPVKSHLHVQPPFNKSTSAQWNALSKEQRMQQSGKPPHWAMKKGVDHVCYWRRGDR